MKLLVFSDTHQREQPMIDIVAQYEDNLDAIIHLGDGASDARQLEEMFPKIPLYAVQGNCDYASLYPSERVEKFGPICSFLAHGHAYGVKENPLRILQKAKSLNADAALYGHTHIPNYTFREGVHLFNPGSLSLPRYGAPTYGLISIDKAIPTFQICRYEG